MKPYRPDNRSWWRRALRSRLVLGINLLLVGFVGWSLAREVTQGREVDAKYVDLENKISALDAQNRNYADVISKLGTPGFVEREARTKLGYQKPGEQVLMLKDAVSAPGVPLSAAAADDSSLSNPAKWWRYFFGG